MLQPLRLQGVCSEASLLVLFILREPAFEPFHMGFAFERQNMRADAVEKEPVVGDDHGAAGEIHQSVFQRAQGFDVEIVGGLVEEQHVAALFQEPRHVHAVALAA